MRRRTPGSVSVPPSTDGQWRPRRERSSQSGWPLRRRSLASEAVFTRGSPPWRAQASIFPRAATPRSGVRRVIILDTKAVAAERAQIRSGDLADSPRRRNRHQPAITAAELPSAVVPARRTGDADSTDDAFPARPSEGSGAMSVLCLNFASEKSAPGLRAEGEHRPLTVLGVAHQHDGRLRRARRPRCTPRRYRRCSWTYARSRPCSSATLMIKSREAPRGSASDLNVSNVRMTLASVAESLVVSPSSGDSK